jgi:hypothetical protein
MSIFSTQWIIEGKSILKKGEPLDIFYYWKDYEKDIKTASTTIGRFVSSKDSFEKLNSARPNFIWAFKTPERCKPSLQGKVQLIARLVWSEIDIVKLPPSKRKRVRSVAYYNPEAKDSVIYNNTDSLASIEHVTNLIKVKFPSVVRANFIGAIEPMEDDF